MPIFDSVLIVSFGGPQGVADIRPFLANVLRGRRVTPQRVEEVARHYELFGGVSPITALTMRQADALRARLAAAGHPLPVYVGMRNWHPFLADTLRAMAADGARHAIGFIAAAQQSYSSCEQYRENVDAARTELRASSGADVSVTYVESWFDHPLFIEANAAHVREAQSRLPEAVRHRARLVCHRAQHSSIDGGAVPLPRAARSLGAARRGGIRHCRLGARLSEPERTSGRSWLEPDICDYLRRERAAGLEAAVICPVGFICDHIEVLYDLDHEAAHVSREIGLPMTRAEAVNDDPRFAGMMTDMVLRVVRRYAGRPLQIASRQ